MSLIEWEQVLTDILSGVGVLIIGGIGGTFFGYFRGKKISSTSIDRKDKLYQPLLDDLVPISEFQLSVLNRINTPVLNEIVTNEYKFGLTTELQEKCNHLYDLIYKFNSIDLVSVAHGILVGIFEKGYEEIYGSIIEGTSYDKNRDGFEIETNHLVLPVELIRRGNFNNSISNLLKNEGMYDREVYLNVNKDNYELVYGDMIDIFNSVLNGTLNGKKPQHPPLEKEIGMLPAEYIAVNSDFFGLFNSKLEIIEKYEIRESIIIKSQEIIEDLKDIIKKIVEKYEREEI